MGAADPFYSEENVARLKKAIQDLDAGKGMVHEVDYGQQDVLNSFGSDAKPKPDRPYP